MAHRSDGPALSLGCVGMCTEQCAGVGGGRGARPFEAFMPSSIMAGWRRLSVPCVFIEVQPCNVVGERLRLMHIQHRRNTRIHSCMHTCTHACGRMHTITHTVEDGDPVVSRFRLEDRAEPFVLRHIVTGCCTTRLTTCSPAFSCIFLSSRV